MKHEAVVLKQSILNIISHFLIALLCLFNLTVSYSAGEYAYNLQGVVKSDGDVGKINIVLIEADGTILDVGSIKADGTYAIDLGTMDEPTYVEVKKLYLKLERGENKKQVRIADYIKEMTRTVHLRPIPFP